MRTNLQRLMIVLGSIAAAIVIADGIYISSAQSNVTTGPSSSQSPYVVPSIPGAITKSILTVGDSVNNKPDGTPYRMVGIPDGLGAFDNGDGTFTVLMNHELGQTSGIVRAHGATGAFVSKWTIRKSDLTVLNGEDLIQNIATYTPNVGYNPPAKGIQLGRLCSATLAPASAFYNAATGLGYNGRILTNGEETGTEGRAFGHLIDGISYELPYLGKFSWENSVPNPATGNKTVVIGMDDGSPGQLYVYVGDKTNTGNPIERAGLSGGNLYGVRVNGVPLEDRTTGIASGTPFDLYNFGNVANRTGAQLELDSNANNVTRFLRPEDGSWDPQNPNDFYFVTTDRFDTFKNPGTTQNPNTPPNQVGRSRLWRLRFIDATNPALGGQLDMLLNGTEPQQMLDNITVRRGQVFMQEDPGNQPHVAKLWRYNIAGNNLNLVAEHDPNRFAPGAPNFLTQDEESSGIIDAAEVLGEGWYLLDVQAHYTIPGELVEGGQFLALYYPERRR